MKTTIKEDTMNKSQYEQWFITTILSPIHGQQDYFPSLLNHFQSIRKNPIFYSGEINEAKENYEREVFNFLMEKLHPHIVELSYQGNLDTFFTFQGNVCKQVTGYSISILKELLPHWKFYAVLPLKWATKFSWSPIESGFNHTTIFGGEENNFRIIELDHKYYSPLWWNIETNKFKYPNVSEYKEIKLLTNVSYVTNLLDPFDNMIKKNSIDIISDLKNTFSSEINHFKSKYNSIYLP
jgi:hypothetical protein